jgi:hypothetical protein
MPDYQEIETPFTVQEYEHQKGDSFMPEPSEGEGGKGEK